MIRLDGGTARGFQSGRLKLSVNDTLQPVDEGELASMPAAAANVAGIYAGLRDDIAHDTSTVADFSHAAKLTKLITDLLAASLDGSRAQASSWAER